MTIYNDLTGKRVMITGAASGIGLATAQRFIEEEARVMIVDMNVSSLEKALSENPSLTGIAGDVSRPDDVAAMFQACDQTMGGLDILIANAGISIRNPFHNMEYGQWMKVMRTNLDGVFLCTQAALSRMRKQKSGVILYTASNNGLAGCTLYADYNASKAAVINLAKTLSLELAPWIRVNAVCPGYVLTPMQKAEYTPEMMEALNRNIPLQRHAAPEEVAALFAFLASEEASYITGQAIAIDGGETAGLFYDGPMEF